MTIDDDTNHVNDSASEASASAASSPASEASASAASVSAVSAQAASSPEGSAVASSVPAVSVPEGVEKQCVNCEGGCSCCGSGDAPRGHLNCYDWLGDIPGGFADSDMVEVQFKNTRKGFYRNTAKLQLAIGDVVAVEASPGHDIGTVSLVGKLVNIQMKKANLRKDAEIRRVFRKAKPADLEKFEEAKAKEVDTMIRSRKIAEDLKLQMKIGDVEYQGDGTKAIFYYIADGRVDFRQLIKVLADVFKIRIEMKQIGARQEAGRIGGIGPCGRPLCCASWMTNFVSVSTSAARYQDISLNPQKLAGQCAKLKCCLNFEVDTYAETNKRMPSKEIALETATATYYHFKTDIFKKQITYSTDKSMPVNLVTIDAQRAFDVIAMNKNGEKPDSLMGEASERKQAPAGFNDIVGQDSVTRFDKKKRKKNKFKKNRQENEGGEGVAENKPAAVADTADVEPTDVTSEPSSANGNQRQRGKQFRQQHNQRGQFQQRGRKNGFQRRQDHEPQQGQTPNSDNNS